MTRCEFIKMRDKAALEIAKMYAASEANIHQPQYTMLRMQVFIGFHTLACAHLRSLHLDWLDDNTRDRIEASLTFVQTLLDDEEGSLDHQELVELLAELYAAKGGGA